MAESARLKVAEQKLAAAAKGSGKGSKPGAGNVRKTGKQPAGGRGRGKGRGKNAPKVSEPEEAENADAAQSAEEPAKATPSPNQPKPKPDHAISEAEAVAQTAWIEKAGPSCCPRAWTS